MRALLILILTLFTAVISHAANDDDTQKKQEVPASALTEKDYVHLFEKYNGQPVITIEFKGAKDVAEDGLCGRLMFGEGDPFDAEQVAVSRLELLDSGKFTSADIEISQGPSGVKVSFVLEEKWHVMSVPLMPQKKRNSAACKAKPSPLNLSGMEGLPIEAIIFTGNKTTRDRVLREELLIHEGDPFSIEKMLQSRQSIKNLGLFKAVWVRAERGTKGAIVTFSVSEKWYILPLPTLSRNTDGDISYGGELTWENTFGLNHRLNLEIEQEDQADGKTEQKASLDYRIPKFIGTRYGMRFGVQRKRTLQDVSDTELPDNIGAEEEEDTLGSEAYIYNDRFNISTSRWFKRIAPSQGWRGGVALLWQRTYWQVTEGNPTLQDDFRVFNFGFSGGFTAVDDFEFYRSGQDYGANLGFGGKAIGSTDDYVNMGIYWRRYQPLRIPVRANLNTQFQFGYNQGQSDQFRLGGADSFRGVLDGDELIGDAFAVLNLNWLIPMRNYPAFRWNIFTDVGNAWSRDDINPFDLVLTFGAGARWKLRFLVNSTLRLDWAYNPSTGGFKVYAGTSNMF